MSGGCQITSRVLPRFTSEAVALTMTPGATETVKRAATCKMHFVAFGLAAKSFNFTTKEASKTALYTIWAKYKLARRQQLRCPALSLHEQFVRSLREVSDMGVA